MLLFLCFTTPLCDECGRWVILKAGFPLAIFFARSDLLFCPSSISSAWLQLRAQEGKKSLLAYAVLE